jgi:hypothetical protein
MAETTVANFGQIEIKEFALFRGTAHRIVSYPETVSAACDA